MAICVRDKCKAPVSRNKEARKLRLCDEHDQRRTCNLTRRKERQNRLCAYPHCGNTLANTRNEKYCNVVCRQLALRKFSKRAGEIVRYSYWRNTSNSLLRNSHQLGSIYGLDDITGLFLLFRLKAQYQRSYALPPIDNLQSRIKPVSLVLLEVCHLYPNSRGGMNVVANLFIAPMLINRKLNDAIPYQGNGFAGIKAQGKRIPLVGSLLNSLITLYGEDAVNDALGNLPRPKIFEGNVARYPTFGGMHKERPLFTLFKHELTRLKGAKDAAFLFDIEKMFPFYPLYLELLAIVSFHAVLSGDPDRLLARMQRIFHACFASPHQGRMRYGRDCHKRYCNVMYGFIRKYLLRNFGVKLESKLDVVDFYNRFFSLKVVDIGWGDQIICYIYGNEQIREEMTFFALPGVHLSPVDILHQLSSDGLDVEGAVFTYPP
ncbi:conserved hypothetical protein [Enterobacterales bacterium 8AC]|nr:conserved hypothetical protein [Enterobacterales bacterium 8AC]